MITDPFSSVSRDKCKAIGKENKLIALEKFFHELSFSDENKAAYYEVLGTCYSKDFDEMEPEIKDAGGIVYHHILQHLWSTQYIYLEKEQFYRATE